jgi:hypothetical protein
MTVRRALGRQALLYGVAISLLACASGDRGPGGRIIAVHNTLQAIGFNQVGEVSEGSLGQGDTQSFTYELEEEGCYVFIAMGSPGVRDVNLALVSPDGEQLASDETTDRQAVLQVCARSAGEHTVQLTMASGQGEYLLAQWAGGDLDLGPGPGGVTASNVEGSCGHPLALELGSTVSGDTGPALDMTSGRCIPGGAPDVAYQFTLDRRAQVCFDMTSTYDGALVLQRECGQPHTEIACNDDFPDTNHSALRETLEPGTYFLISTGYGDARGTFSVTSAIAESPSPADVCAQASPLPLGQDVTGTTAGCVADAFQATCAAGARSPEKVYRFNLAARSRVRVDGATTSHDGALYIRSNCTDPASEIVCNDDYGDNRHSLLTATLDAGTYYLFADGYAEGEQGTYNIRAQVAALGGSAIPGDACSSAQPLAPGRIRGSTMPAAADVTGTCAGSQDAADVVYSLNVTEASRLRVRMVRSDMRAALYLQSTCGAQASEIVCAASEASTPFPMIERVVQPGTYFVVVDGVDQNEFGEFEMDVELTSTREIDRQCREAPLLRTGTPVSGSTSGSDEFHASCADGARSPEGIYRLQLRRRQLVRLALEASFDGALYVRRSCLDESTEVACNDDAQDTQHSLIEVTLGPGTYYVFVDGFAEGNQGQYTLRVELENP